MATLTEKDRGIITDLLGRLKQLQADGASEERLRGAMEFGMASAVLLGSEALGDALEAELNTAKKQGAVV